jgi:hypothetical protein
MNKRLIVDGLAFEIRESERRETVEIIVDRDGSLILAVPLGFPEDRQIAFIQEKLVWVHTKLAEKEDLAQPKVEKEYVQGEGFYYLGRHHRLKLVEEQEVPLRLYRGRFTLLREEVERGREHFIQWYRARLEPVLERHLESLTQRIEREPAQVHIQDLGYKWGTTDRRDHLYFHWRVALLPHRMIEYIVAHELSHLYERSHSEEFWKQLERLVPDYGERKRWLAQQGGKYDL